MAVGFRHAVGQFSVLNLFYGPKFQKQMPILQLYISLLWKRFRESYKKSFNLEDLIVDFFNILTCAILWTKQMKKLNHNLVEEEDSIKVLENFISVDS